MLALTTFVALAVTASAATAQGFGGTFTARTDDGAVLTLSLREDPGGIVTGSMAGDGPPYLVEGRVEGDVVVGILRSTQARRHFEAGLWERGVWLTLFASDDLGRPAYDVAREYTFYDAASGGPLVQPPRPGGGAGAPTAGNPLSGGGSPAGPGNPLGRGGDPFAGTFTDGNVTLRLQGIAGRYEGQITLGGATYGVTASGGRSGLQGVLRTADGTYPMTLQSIDGVLYVESGGEMYHLYPRDAYGYGYGPGGVRGAWPPGIGAVPPGGFPTPGTAVPPVRTDPGPGAAPRTSPLADRWVRFLVGNALTRVRAAPGGPFPPAVDRVDLALCPDDSFSMIASGGLPDGAREPQVAYGTWAVAADARDTRLLLDLDDGTSIGLRLEFRGDATFVEGQRAYVTPTARCR